MNKEERASLAEQILTNPLFPLIIDELEQNAINSCINAAHTDHEKRAAFAAETRAIRAFRGNLVASLRDNSPTKGAPA